MTSAPVRSNTGTKAVIVAAHNYAGTAQKSSGHTRPMKGAVMAVMSEEQIYEAFGLGAQEQDPAAPADEASQIPSEGAQEQESADPVQDESQTTAGTQTDPTAEEAEPEEPDDHADGSTGDRKLPLTQEQRRENAAKRRQQEQQAQQAAIKQAVQDAVRQTEDRHNAQMEEFFSRANLKNTITGEPITNMEQFNAWNEQFQEAKLQRELKAGKLTQEGLATAIGNHPMIKQAQKLVEQDVAQKRSQEQAAAKARIDSELAEIHDIDASINTLEDLFQAPYGKELYAMTQKGYSIKDAHYLLTKDTLEAARLEAARQAGLNSARSKDHLNATGAARGSGSVSVPKADMQMYRLFNPDATDAQIQEHYNKTHKR